MSRLARPVAIIISAVLFYITLQHAEHLSMGKALLAGVLSGAVAGMLLRIAKGYHEEN